jgi:hypothetical protein
MGGVRRNEIKVILQAAVRRRQGIVYNVRLQVRDIFRRILGVLVTDGSRTAAAVTLS